jgi:hypothetical protein
MLDGVEVRALCRPVKFFHTDLDKPFLYGPRIVHGDIVMLKQEMTFLNSWHHAFGQVRFSWHPPNPDLSVGLPDGEVEFIPPENAFPLLQSPMVANFTPLLPMLGIVCCCSAM